VTIRSKFPDDVEAVMRPVGRLLGRSGISPNMLTTLGLVLTAAATWAIANQHPMIAAGLLIGGGLMDLLDGAVARARSRATPFGGFYDSVSDRLSDGMILGGIAWWVHTNPRLFMLAITALVAAEVTSYVRARAEAIDLTCTIGILERAERAVLVIVGLLFHQWLLEPVLWVLAVGGMVTVVQRVHHVWCQIDRDIPDELLAMAMVDRAWSRAFKAGARRFYGERNFDGAVGGREATAASGDGRDSGPERGPGDGQGAGDGQARTASEQAPADPEPDEHTARGDGQASEEAEHDRGQRGRRRR
jgi:CDP-diacylglycerol---glycerol-3-phosphate 3-phosphatidyltransferase